MVLFALQDGTPAQCGFQHTFAPWFVLAVSGPKSIVIVLDASTARVSQTDFAVSIAGMA